VNPPKTPATQVNIQHQERLLELFARKGVKVVFKNFYRFPYAILKVFR
jgi:hypothetical protein